MTAIVTKGDATKCEGHCHGDRCNGAGSKQMDMHSECV